MKLTLTQNPYIDGGDNDFLRDISEEGVEAATGHWGPWYTASAVGEDGNHYSISWLVSDREAFDAGDQEYCCDWDDPIQIYSLDEYRTIPLDSVELDWSEV